MNMAKPEPQCVIRQAARLLIVSPQNQLLLFLAEEPATGRRFWITPGGGVEEGETFSAAAARECREETGLDLEIGPCVWMRRHLFFWNGIPHDQTEQFYFARSDTTVIRPLNSDPEHRGERWWSLDQLLQSSEEFAPRRLVELLPALLRGEFPDQPVDCGVC